MAVGSCESCLKVEGIEESKLCSLIRGWANVNPTLHKSPKPTGRVFAKYDDVGVPDFIRVSHGH